MKIEDLLRNQIRNLDISDSQNSLFIKQLLEYWATFKDNEINNRLLRDLVSKYASAERELSRLNRELLNKQSRLDEDLVAAAEIQKSLLPQKLNSTENLDVAWRFEPCEHMGGDIFNVFQLDDDHWGIYMLDVSGHGVPAAMVTVSVSQFLQPNSGHVLRKTGKASASYEFIPPAEVLAALDREFPFERFNNFFTITYIILNTKNGRLRYSNAGHPYSILLRKRRALELLKKGGPGIGLGEFQILTEKKHRFEEEQLQIQPGDKLFVYTDGIVEYQNDRQEFYGDGRFYEKLENLKKEPVKKVVDQSIKSLMKFGNYTNPQDDITLLGLELKTI
jgi:sigma-B regulation protein RsbU (phosphoserine phosphatase)